MNKFIRIIYIILLAICALLGILFYAGGTGANDSPIFTNTFIVWAYILTGIATLSAIVFPIVKMVGNPQNAKKSIMGVVALLIVVAIAYFFSSGDLMKLNDPEMAKYNIHSTLKEVDTGIITTYLLIGIAIVAMIYTEVAKIFK
jgi:peptidoglycan/LPS O-acetylase OafA/YrhL